MPIVLQITENLSASDDTGLQGRFARASPTKAPLKPLETQEIVIQAGRYTVVSAFVVAAGRLRLARPCTMCVKNSTCHETCHQTTFVIHPAEGILEAVLRP